MTEVTGLLRGIKPPRANAGEFLVFVGFAKGALGFFVLKAESFDHSEKRFQSRFGLCAHFGSSIPRIEKSTNSSKPRETVMTVSLAAANAVDLMTER